MVMLNDNPGHHQTHSNISAVNMNVCTKSKANPSNSWTLESYKRAVAAHWTMLAAHWSMLAAHWTTLLAGVQMQNKPEVFVEGKVKKGDSS